MSVLWPSAIAASAESVESGARPYAARCVFTSSWIRSASEVVEIVYGSSENFPGTGVMEGVAVAAVVYREALW